MESLDKCEQLLADSSFTVAILFNPNTSDFELVRLDAPIGETPVRGYMARGLEFSGVIGLVAGQPRVALDVPIEGEAAQRIVRAFLDRLEDELNRQMPKAESVDWLQRLWGLKDLRSN